MTVASEDHEQVAAGYRAAEHIYAGLGSPLYAAFCREGADDPAILDLTAGALAGAAPVHLFTSAHYLLLGGIDHPAARYFDTLTENAGPPEEAWPDFRDFCLAHSEEIRELILTRPVQMTYVERCRSLLPPMCVVAAEAGEPLSIIELGCSAGAMLVFDAYSYEMREGERLGDNSDSIVLTGELHGGPELFIPRIGTRAGIDLNLINPSSEDDRRWMIASCYPELVVEQGNLSQALDIVAATEITWREGDALKHLPELLERAPDPTCIYHSACLFYWPDDAKAKLENLLCESSHDRPIWRIGIEPSPRFDTWQAGKSEAPGEPKKAAKASGEITISRYRDGCAEHEIVADQTSDFGTVIWRN